MATVLREQVLGVLELVAQLHIAHAASVLQFVKHEGDKFFIQEVIDLFKTVQDVVGLVNGFIQRKEAVMNTVPKDFHASVVTSLRLHQLQVVMQALSAPQILALFRGVQEGSSREQVFQQLTGLQKVLQQQPLTNLRNVHLMYRDSGPDYDVEALTKMLGIGKDLFFVIPMVRQALSLDADQLKSLRDALSSFSAVHFQFVVDLLSLDNFEALEMRGLFVPLIIEEPEGFMGGGFGLGLSGEKNGNAQMDERDDDEDDEEWQPPLKVEILEQPPLRCVYRRNLRPSPEVRIHGIEDKNPNLRVAVEVVRCDTMSVLDETSLSGELIYPAAPNMTVAFKKLKILQTSHQLGDTHFALRFVLRNYVPGSSTDFSVVHSVQSIPFLVMSHSTQLHKPQQVTPIVSEVIPSAGFMGGGTRVVLLGNNFMDTPSLRVRFDQTDVQPQYKGPRTLVCSTPPHAVGPVSVRVCNDGRKWGDAAENGFSFVAERDPVYEEPTAEAIRGSPTRMFFDLGSSNGEIRQAALESDGLDMTFILSQNFRSGLSGSFTNMDLSNPSNLFDSGSGL